MYNPGVIHFLKNGATGQVDKIIIHCLFLEYKIRHLQESVFPSATGNTDSFRCVPF